MWDTACMHTGDEPVSGGRRPHAPSQSNSGGVSMGKPPAGKTGAVNLDTSKYLGATAPSSSGGHPASSSASSRSAEKPLVFRHGECHGFAFSVPNDEQCTFQFQPYFSPTQRDLPNGHL